MRVSPLMLLFASLWLLGFDPGRAAAQKQPLTLSPQSGRYTPLNQYAPPGKVGHWQLLVKPSLYGYFQPVQVRLPTRGTVTFYSLEPPGAFPMPAPAQAGMLIGAVYRLKVSDLPEFPGLELYPTIELTDRLHPPAEQVEAFPVPVEITLDEIAAAQDDRFVTKVVYLERPQLAANIDFDEGKMLTYDVPGASNLLDAADQLGRPIAILRLGGRIPSPYDPADNLIGRAPPIRIVSPTASQPARQSLR